MKEILNALGDCALLILLFTVAVIATKWVFT